MAHSPRIAKLHEECIPYIERCGWKFIGRNFGSYWFKGMDGRKTMSGNETISFTLTELRHAFNNGW